MRNETTAFLTATAQKKARLPEREVRTASQVGKMEEEMEEKKLTDKEIVKAYSNCADHDNCCECPLWQEMKRRNCICREIVLGVIRRLQDENERLKKDRHDMSWIIKVHKYCVGADHCQNSSTREFELQKQVDELKEENEHLDSENTRLICEMDKMLDDGWDIMDEEADGWYKKGGKDTAKEICLKIVKDQPQPIQEKWVEWFKKEYGVEVE